MLVSLCGCPDGVECVGGCPTASSAFVANALARFVILAAPWRLSFKQRDAFCVVEAANPHGNHASSAIRLLKPDSCLSRTDGYPRFCRRARSRHSRGCSGAAIAARATA